MREREIQAHDLSYWTEARQDKKVMDFITVCLICTNPEDQRILFSAHLHSVTLGGLLSAPL